MGRKRYETGPPHLLPSRRAMKNDSVVAGGGAIDMELSKYLRNYSRTIAGKEQLIIGAMAKAFEVSGDGLDEIWFDII